MEFCEYFIHDVFFLSLMHLSNWSHIIDIIICKSRLTNKMEQSWESTRDSREVETYISQNTLPLNIDMEKGQPH